MAEEAGNSLECLAGAASIADMFQQLMAQQQQSSEEMKQQHQQSAGEVKQKLTDVTEQQQL